MRVDIDNDGKEKTIEVVDTGKDNVETGKDNVETGKDNVETGKC